MRNLKKNKIDLTIIFITSEIKSSLKKYLSYVYLLNYKDVSDMTELQSSLPASLKENIKLAIHDIGIKEV
ncbi:MAG: hypothetical protein ACTSRS_11690, partial [Candidatus Helarchaeota archaeon]